MEVSVTSPVRENATGQFRPNVHISMELLQQAKTMDEYTRMVFAQLQPRLTGLKFLKMGRQNISNTVARWWIITYREKSVNMKGVLYIVVKGNRAFTISTASSLEQYPAYKDVLGEIGGSLTIQNLDSTP